MEIGIFQDVQLDFQRKPKLWNISGRYKNVEAICSIGKTSVCIITQNSTKGKKEIKMAVVIKLHNLYIGEAYATKEEIVEMEQNGFTVIKKGE